MRIGYADSAFGDYTEKLEIVAETIEFDDEAEENIARILWSFDELTLFDITRYELQIKQILSYLRKRGKYVVKHFTITKDLYDKPFVVTGSLQLRDKKDVGDIKEIEIEEGNNV